MKFIMTALLFNFKRVIKTRAFILIILLLPAVILAAAQFFDKESSIINIRIGIVYNEDNKFSRDLFKNMIKNNGITFEKFASDEQGLEEIYHLVKTGEMECAYVFCDDIEDRIRSGKFNEIIKLIKSPETAAHIIVNEIIFAGVIEAGVTDITVNELVRAFKIDEVATRKIIEEKVTDYYYNNDDLFLKPKYSYEEGAVIEEVDSTLYINRRILHGMIAVFMMTLTVFITPRFIEEKKNGIIKKLGFKNMLSYYFSLLLTFFVFNFALGALSIFLIKNVYPPGIGDISLEINALVLYAAVICMLGLLLISMLRKPDVIYSGYIFILILTFCFGGVLFDLRELGFSLEKISNLFITSSYINYSVYDESKAACILAAVFIAALIGTMLFLKRELRKYRINA